MRNDSNHEQEWRDWIKLTKRKKSNNEDIEYYKKRIEDLEEELYQLSGRVFNQSHEMRVRKWTTEDAMPAENFPKYKPYLDEPKEEKVIKTNRNFRRLEKRLHNAEVQASMWRYLYENLEREYYASLQIPKS